MESLAAHQEELDHDDAMLNDFAESGVVAGTGLDSTSTVHDRHQFESKFDFNLGQGGRPDDVDSYEIDMYFFVPRSMGVPSEIYPRDRFFANLTHYLRIHAPDLHAHNHGDVVEWTLASADNYLANHLKTLRRQQLAPIVVQDVRLFGCFVFTNYKRLLVRFGRILEREEDATRERLVRRVLDELWELDATILVFRERYVQRVRLDSIMLDAEVKRAFLLVDEYVSYGRESALVRFLRSLERASDEVERTRVAAALRSEMEYRRQSLALEHGVRYERAKDREAAERETHYYRLGLLKKYVSGVLFVTSVPIKRDKFYKNAIGAVGAALAALWATLAQVQTAQMLNDGGGASVRLALVIVLGVIAYVFKDRIKELSKEYFNERMKHKIPDFEATLNYPYVDASGHKRSETIGVSSEFLRYIGRSAVPAEAAFVRDMGHNAELEPERQESVIHYSKRITLAPQSVRRGVVHRVHDVMRFDISEFLTKLSDPNKVLTVYDPDRGVRTLEAPKVYHLNLVYRYTRLTVRKGAVVARSVELERIRLVLNKKRIVRIEQVLPRGEMRYSEGAI